MKKIDINAYYTANGFTLKKQSNILGGKLVQVIEEPKDTYTCPHCGGEAMFSTLSKPRKYKESKLITGKPTELMATRIIARCSSCKKRFTSTNDMFYNSMMTTACKNLINYYSELKLPHVDVAQATGVDESTIRRYRKSITE